MTEGNGEEPSASQTSLDAALHNIKEFGVWIGNSDQKSSVVGAALAVVLSSLGFQREQLHSTLEAGLKAPLALGVLMLLVIAILVTGVRLYLAMMPRTHEGESGEQNRFAWPRMVTETVDNVVTAADSGSLAYEAWDQSITLATIANLKFRHFRKALRWFGAVLVLYLLWLLVSGTV